MSNESTGLIATDPKNYLALSGGGGLAAAREANGESFGVGMLTRVRTPAGGATTWEIDDGLGNISSAREIVGALVIYRKRATLWGRNDTVTEGVKPYLVSNDHPALARGYLVPGGDPGDLDTDLIDACMIDDGTGDIDIRPKSAGGEFPYAEFGSSGKPGSKGRRIKEQRLLGILRPGEMFPLLITVQPGSLKNITNVVARFALPHFHYIVKLTLKKETAATGEPYSQLQMAVAGTLPEEQALALKAEYTDPLNRAFAERMIALDGDGDA